MSDVQAWEAREELLAQNPGQLDLVLSGDGRDPDDAGVAADALRWQTMTPAEQWALFFGDEKGR